MIGILMIPLNFLRRARVLTSSAAIALSAVITIASEPEPGVSWPATDALGRTLPLIEEAGPLRKDRFVGIFYFLTHDEPIGIAPGTDGPYDISKIIARDPQALLHPDSPLWGPIGMAHYWGEPLFGYYRSTDPWVLRRHAQLLAAAGIDTLIFDTTNAVTYSHVYQKLCEVFSQVRAEGGHTPQIAFMVNTEAGKTAAQIYHDLYQPGRYRDLWFVWQGKPLMICDPADASPELKQFFTLRAAHWPFTLVNTRYAWHWESTYPQPYGYTDDPKKPEQVNVAVAQNLRAADGRVTNMSEGNARGRSFHDGKEDTTAGAVNYGHNFAEQWKRALVLDPPFVMVTGWNEWIAGRFGNPHGPIVFVDQYDEEFSRDIEPMKGGHSDNYYYQLVSNVRRYKGVAPIPRAFAPVTIDIAGDLGQWKNVEPHFAPSAGLSLPRDEFRTGQLHNANHVGRHTFESFKVARDAKNIYFYARVQAPYHPRYEPNWMWLLIDIDRNPKTGWEGYDFIVDRTIGPDGSAWLEKNTGGWKWEKVAKITSRVVENEMQLAIPRKDLGLPEGSDKLSFNFKWADDSQTVGDTMDIMDFYLSGDVAPPGRFMFRYDAQ